MSAVACSGFLMPGCRWRSLPRTWVGTARRSIARSGIKRIQLEPWLRRYRFHEHAYVEGYFPVTAQDLAHERRQRLAKLRRHAALRGYVVNKLKACWSPQQIAGRLRLEGASLCHETIYRYVYSSEGRAAALYRLLPASRRQRRQRFCRKPRCSFIPAARAIVHRPAEAADRRSFGHWEADLIIFRREHRLGQPDLDGRAPEPFHRPSAEL